jgi:hypothetical protein
LPHPLPCWRLVIGKQGTSSLGARGYGERKRPDTSPPIDPAAHPPSLAWIIPLPPLTEEFKPLAVWLPPPLTEEKTPLAVLLTPPLTEEKTPLAILSSPPLIADHVPLAVLSRPPLTVENSPLAVLSLQRHF